MSSTLETAAAQRWVPARWSLCEALSGSVEDTFWPMTEQSAVAWDEAAATFDQAADHGLFDGSKSTEKGAMPKGDVETYHQDGAWHNRVEGGQVLSDHRTKERAPSRRPSVRDGPEG